MVDADGVTVLDGIQELKKGGSGEVVIADVVAAVGDVCEEVAFWAVLEDDKGGVGIIDDVQHRHDAGMLAGLCVQVQLALLELALSVIEAESVECLYSIGNMSVYVEGDVDDTISADAKDTGELKTIRQQMSKSVLGRADAGKERRWGWSRKHGSAKRWRIEGGQKKMRISGLELSSSSALQLSNEDPQQRWCDAVAIGRCGMK